MSLHLPTKTNIVQAIRAYRVQELQQAARENGQHFLYTNLSQAQTREEVLASIVQQFTLPPLTTLSFGDLFECITDPVHKSGSQPGFIVVLEHIPSTTKFDKELRESLLDVFRDAADYWLERRVAFRCFYSYSVARSRNALGGIHLTDAPLDTLTGEMVPASLVDVTLDALRMSSPFNSGYWLASAVAGSA